MASMVISPIALTFQNQLVPGSVATPDPGVSIKNPYRSPMWIDEIRFNFSSEGMSAIPGNLVAIRAKLNGKYFINEPVLIRALVPQLDITETLLGGGDSGNYVWKLWKPIWMDADDEMDLELSWQIPQLPNAGGGLPAIAWGNSGATNVIVTVLGRSTTLNNRPQVRHLPWATKWTTEFINYGSPVPYLQRSPDSAIANQLRHHVNVRRMLCAFGFGNDFPQALDAVPESFVNNTLRISDSNGVYIAKDPIPLFELFTGTTRAYDLNFVMKPKDFWTLEFTFGNPDYLTDSFDIPTVAYNVFYQFALTGFTEEALHQL